MKFLAILLFSFFHFVFTEEEFVKIAIVGTNDIHGSAFPTRLYRSDSKQSYNYGGLEYMASMIETLRKQYPGNFLYFDAGDQFQGGIEAGPLVSYGQIINDYMKVVKIDASAIGNHEFDFGSDFLIPYLGDRKPNSWNLAANLVSEKDEQQFLPNHKNMFLYKLRSGIKIGVIGLSTIETPYTTDAFRKGLFPSYKFKDYAEIVQESSKKLRKEGADAVILLGHLGNVCTKNNKFGIWFQDKQQNSNCDQTDQISKLLEQIPNGTVDGIIQGHRHSFSHHFIKGVPILGTINGGAYFNILYLQFINKKIYSKFIEGPVPVCQKVFQIRKTCNYLTKQELKTAGKLVSWKFHSVQVVKHPQVQKLFQTKWRPFMDRYFQPIVFNEILLQKTYSHQNLLGNLITDLISSACPGHNFVWINSGVFRTTWYPGIIQYQHLYNMFPFKDDLISFQMAGYELIKTLEIIQNGKKSYYPTHNLLQKVKILKNGTKRLLNVTFMDGTPLQLSKMYRGVSIGFLMKGGDDFGEVIGKIYTLRKQIVIGELRNLLKRQLMKLKVISQAKLLDSKSRIEIDYQ